MCTSWRFLTCLAGHMLFTLYLPSTMDALRTQGEALLSKQTAVYSLQRKLKACRQALQSRELHMSLLQRKTDGLEQTMKESGRLKMELEGAVNKV